MDCDLYGMGFIGDNSRELFNWKCGANEDILSLSLSLSSPKNSHRISISFVIAVQWPIWVSCLNIWNYYESLPVSIRWALQSDFPHVFHNNSKSKSFQIKPNQRINFASNGKDFNLLFMQISICSELTVKIPEQYAVLRFLHHEKYSYSMPSQTA